MAGLFHRMYKRWIQNIVPPRAPNCKHGVPIYEKIIPCRFRFCPSGGGCTFCCAAGTACRAHTPNGFCPGGRSLPRRHAAAFAHAAAQQCSKWYHRPGCRAGSGGHHPCLLYTSLRAKSRRKASVALRSASLRLGVRHGICVAKMLDNTQSIICAFGLASAAPRSPYRHLELCGIA